jgi:hypothetical protein
VKHGSHQQKVVWYLNSGLGQQGLTANASINRIYLVYGVQTRGSMPDHTSAFYQIKTECDIEGTISYSSLI